MLEMHSRDSYELLGIGKSFHTAGLWTGTYNYTAERPRIKLLKA